MTESADDPKMVPRSLKPGQRTEVWIAKVGGGPPELLYSTGTALLEAPNWSPDGRGLLLNADGMLRWSPDSRRYAFVAYPVQQKQGTR